MLLRNAQPVGDSTIAPDIMITPRLKTINPLAAVCILIFGYFNVILGIALFTVRATFVGNLVLLSYLYSYQVWGVIFLILGVLMLYLYHQNSYRRLRGLIFVALCLKCFWWFALLFRWILDYDNVIILIIWSVILALQIALYIYFPMSTVESAGEKE